MSQPANTPSPRIQYAWKRPHFITNPFVRFGLLTLAAGYLIYAFSSLEVDPQRIMRGIPRAIQIFLRGYTTQFCRPRQPDSQRFYRKHPNHAVGNRRRRVAEYPLWICGCP